MMEILLIKLVLAGIVFFGVLNSPGFIPGWSGSSLL